MKLCFNEMTALKNGTLPEDIVLCAKTGFPNIELRKGNVIKFLRRGGSVQQLNEILLQNRVHPASLNALENVTFQDKLGMRAVKELADWLFSACKAIGCPCAEVIASFDKSDRTEKEIREETVQSLLQLSDVAANYGVNLALEFMAVPGSSVRSYEQCLEIIRDADRSNIGMLLDTWHFYAMGAKPDDIAHLDAAKLFMVHVSDCPERLPGTAIRSESYWPGEGVIPLAEILQNINRIGYNGMCSVEVMSPDVHALPVEAGMLTAHEKMETLMRAASVWEA